MTDPALPEEFIEWMSRQLPPEELPAFLNSYDAPYLRGYRLNTLKGTGSLPEGSGEPIPWEPSGRYLSQAS